MKNISLFMLLATLNIGANSFKDLLLVKKNDGDSRYYQLIPVIEKKPAITFIRSRESESMSLERKFLEMIQKASGAKVFYETGTYKGDTTVKAVKYFESVYSIELDESLFKKAEKRFKDSKNIFLYHGDSAKVLPQLLKKNTQKAVIFLDAHYSMGETAQGDANTPIITELEQIKKCKITDAFLIIDDIRMFYTPVNDVANSFIENYPTLQEIVEKILAINPDYQCAVVYDTLLAFPACDKISVSNTVMALTMSRLYDGTNYLIDDILKAELAIAHAPKKEQDTILDLANRWIEPWSKPAGLSQHLALWAGLILLAQEQFGQANTLLLECQARGLRDWRIEWYITMAQAECFFDVR